MDNKLHNSAGRSTQKKTNLTKKSFTSLQKQRKTSLQRNTIPSPELSRKSELSRDSIILPKRPSSLPHLKKQRVDITFRLNESNLSDESVSLLNLQKTGSSSRKIRRNISTFPDNPQNDSSKSNSYHAFNPLMVSSRCSNSTPGLVNNKSPLNIAGSSSKKTQKPADDRSVNASSNREGICSPVSINNENYSECKENGRCVMPTGTTATCKYHDGSFPSLVTRIFRGNHECQKTNKHEMQSEDDAKHSRRRKIRKKQEFDMPNQPTFPKYGEFCTKYFYERLIQKLEPEYQISTNAQAVKVAKFISAVIDEVTETDSNHEELTDSLKKLLSRKKIICTHLDFFYFCIKYLPSHFVKKVVPMGFNNIDFDWNLAHSPVDL